MERKHKISIPEPCHEDWNKMTPNDNGRFCMSCAKTVVDFTSMLPEEIQHFFIQNKNEKICGRFKKSQLETITIQIPNRILYSQTHYRKIFLLALFVAMGTTLFSCQTKDGTKQKIEKVEITDDPSKFDSPIGKAKIHKNDSTCDVPPPPAPPSKEHDNLTNSVKHTNRISGEVILENQKTKGKNSSKPSSTKSEKKNDSQNEDVVYNGGIAIETNAEFPDGIEQFYNFIEKEFKKTENSESANLKIQLSFIVERNGSVTYLRSEPAIDDITEKEIARVFSLCPKWKPGETNGKKARRLYSLPIVLQ